MKQIAKSQAPIIPEKNRKMGCQLTKESIVSTGTQLLQEYFSQNILGQAVSALTAPSVCSEPQSDSKVTDYMKCQLHSLAKRGWEQVIVLEIIVIVMAIIIIHLLYKRASKAIVNFAKKSDNRMYNLQLTRAMAGQTDPEARNQEVAIDMGNDRGQGDNNIRSLWRQ